MQNIFYIKKIILTCASLLLFTLSSCNQNNTEVVQGLNEKLQFNYTEYRATIKKMFISGDLHEVLKDSSFHYYDTLKYFYSKNDFRPVFAKSFEQKNLIYSLFTIFSNAGEHGLNPENYHFKLIAKLCNPSIFECLNLSDKNSRLAKAELLVSDAILKYSYHLRYGLTNPKEIFPDSYFLPVSEESNRNLFEPFYQDSIVQYLQDIQPKSVRYKRLQTALKQFNNYKNIKWQEITFPDKKLEPGNLDSSLINIYNSLITLGFLDTSRSMISDYTVYDSLLISPLKKFQRTRGLNDDGVIGKNTIEKLNTSPEEYINKIKINLERFRWFNYPDTSPYIVVNVPDFRLYVKENGTEIFNMKVCVGRRRPANFKERYEHFKATKNWKDKPDDWETPNLYSEVSYLILNPTWNVPASIIREEIFRKVIDDSTYLHSRKFKVYIEDSVEINLDEVVISELYTDNIPYRIVQDPGAINALGRIKFMFYNPFGIYLHDTPTRRPFSYSNRAVSHGCVRLENPLLLAGYFLRNHSRWDIDFLKIEIGGKVNDKSKIAEYQRKRSFLRRNKTDKKSTEIILDKKFPLFIDYYTAWVDDKGVINFRDDIYRKDEVLMEHL